MKEETKCYCGHTTYCDCGPKQDVKYDMMQEYAEFCIRCYNENLPLLLAKDWCEQINNK